MQNLNPRFLIINQGEYQLLILPTSNEKSNAQLIRLDFAFEGDECEIVKTEDDDEPFEFM
ncbi:MAG: hypothetical protein COA52_00905 [Hyphomicrobiales bacterium]|nr:MAG: hypothetical protein COA52_00905 [Hyphomicrobiales bacterium]